MADCSFNCDLCGLIGPVQYRVCSQSTPQWKFVCRQCWTTVVEQQGYRYGGTRKASRRKRARETPSSVECLPAEKKKTKET